MYQRISELPKSKLGRLWLLVSFLFGFIVMSGMASALSIVQVPADEGGWWQWLLSVQRNLQGGLADAVGNFKKDGTLNTGLTLIIVSFLYGIFHAAGPGHGKGVISSYVLANRATLRRGIVLSFASGMLQAVSAIAIVGVFAILLNAAGLEIRQAVRRFEIASSLLIIGAGLWLLAMHLYRRYRATHRVAMNSLNAAVVHSHDHGQHCDGCSCGKSHMPDAQALETKLSLRGAVAVVFAVGIRPCTGAILVLVFSLAQGIFWAGIISTFVMALGTAITVSALATLAVGSREIAVRFAGSRWTDGIYNVATIAGCFLVMAVGGILLQDALGPVQPF
jgi:nickel/cobalt transporter (NicO) family protein